MRQYRNTTLILACALTATGAAVSACSGSSGSSGSTTATGAATSSPTGSGATSSPIGGEAVCDQAELTKQVERVLTAGGSGMKLQSFNAFECAPGWGAAKVTVGPPENEMILIFRAEGQFWLPAPMNVCGASQAESAVPAELYDFACPAT